MGKFAVGEVVLGYFPFSDIDRTGKAKKRPCLVVGLEDHGDIILAQITSKAYSSKRAHRINSEQFESGGLPVVSYLRPDKLFTADPVLIDRSLGIMTNSARLTVLSKIQTVFVEV